MFFKKNIGEVPEKYSFGSQKHVAWEKWTICKHTQIVIQQNGLQRHACTYTHTPHNKLTIM